MDDHPSLDTEKIARLNSHVEIELVYRSGETHPSDRIESILGYVDELS